MRTDIVYGYGIGHDVLSKISEESIQDYIRKYDPDLFNDIINDIQPGETFNDVAEEMSQDALYGDESVWAFVAQILTRNTGITFEYHRASEWEDEGIMFVETLPWFYNEKEKNISQEEIDDILKKFCCEIGYDGDVKPDTLSIEYFG